MAVLRYVSDHIEQVIGGLVVLFLLTSILLLIRNIGQKDDSSGGSGKRGSDDLDIGAIEAAMKRVLSAQGGVALGAVDASASALAAAASSNSGSAEGPKGTPEAEALAETLRERDSKVQELAREIDRLTAEVEIQKASSGPGVFSAAPKEKELQQKIEELQARLSEYEIIEDDIADLSLYKEENARLKSELDSLKSGIGAPAAVAAAATPEVAPEVAPAVEAEPVVEAVAKEAPEAAPPVAAPVAATPSQEEIDALFALAPTDEASAVAEPVEPAAKKASAAPMPEIVQVTSTSDELNIEVSPVGETSTENSIFGDSLDTEKMLSEVENLGEGGDDAEDVLGAALDTDKLMQEMAGTAATPAPVATPAPAAGSTPVGAPVGALEEEAVGEDDLLAEFKDSNDGGQG